jgi:hypothetical protein
LQNEPAGHRFCSEVVGQKLPTSHAAGRAAPAAHNWPLTHGTCVAGDVPDGQYEPAALQQAEAGIGKHGGKRGKQGHEMREPPVMGMQECANANRKRQKNTEKVYK